MKASKNVSVHPSEQVYISVFCVLHSLFGGVYSQQIIGIKRLVPYSINTSRICSFVFLFFLSSRVQRKKSKMQISSSFGESVVY